MSIPLRYAPRRAHVPYWWLLATAAAGFIALGPIVAAVVASFGSGGPSSAFASAPAGNYAVVARAEAAADVLLAVGQGGDAPREIARVAHLPGYVSYGAVSPTNDRLALVVADGGTQAHPLASLVAVDLKTGETRRLAANVDYLQTPVWSRDGGTVVVSRTTGSGPRANVRLSAVSMEGGETTLAEAENVLGAYAVGFNREGELIHVVIDGSGSVAYRGGSEVAVLAAGITRDWRLNEDGSAIAFVETASQAGVKYFARTAALVAGVGAQALSSADGRQSLGVAWRPGSAEATFGAEPQAAPGSVGAQSLAAAGFDVPLAYSSDGAALAVQHWSGASFADPGQGSLELVSDDGTRQPLNGYNRFYGWATK